jgi:hypothetical protein
MLTYSMDKSVVKQCVKFVCRAKFGINYCLKWKVRMVIYGDWSGRCGWLFMVIGVEGADGYLW